jgi:hypothetical protein
MKKLFLVLLAFVSVARGQTSTNSPRTYFEYYDAVPDSPLVKGMTSIGTLNNEITFPVEVRAERLSNLQSSNTVYAVSLRTRISRQILLVDYIDYDEVDGLIRGLQLISQSDHSVTPMENFEVAYRTRGGLSIVKRSEGNKVVIAMRSGDPTNSQRNPMAAFVLDDLSRYLTAAKAKIDALVAAGP